MDYLSNQPVSLEEIQNNLDFYSRYTNLRLYKGKDVYRLHEKIRAFINQPFPSKEERQKAHGNLVWMLKKYYSKPFEKEAIALVNSNIAQLDLTDNDKLNYLSYILAIKNYNRFDFAVFHKLSDFSLSDDNSKNTKSMQARNVFNKIKRLLETKYKKTDEYQKTAERCYRFLDNYAVQCPQVSHNLINEYCDVLFKMSAKFPFQRIPLRPMKDLLEKTVNLRHNQVRMNNLFAGEDCLNQSAAPQIDKKAVAKVLGNYVNYSLKLEEDKKVDDNLYYSMSSMMCYIVSSYDYKSSEVKDLRSLLGNRIASTTQRSKLYALGRLMQNSFNSARPKSINPRNKTIDPLMAKMNSRW